MVQTIVPKKKYLRSFILGVSGVLASVLLISDALRGSGHLDASMYYVLYLVPVLTMLSIFETLRYESWEEKMWRTAINLIGLLLFPIFSSTDMTLNGLLIMLLIFVIFVVLAASISHLVGWLRDLIHRRYQQ